MDVRQINSGLSSLIGSLVEGREKFIIVKDSSRGTKFWNGSGWSSEYPDALQYDGIRAAKKEIKSRKISGAEAITVDEYDSGEW